MENMSQLINFLITKSIGIFKITLLLTSIRKFYQNSRECPEISVMPLEIPIGLEIMLELAFKYLD